MRGLYDIIARPCGGRYNNTKQVGDKELIVNTEVFNHQYVNREAVVEVAPRVNELGLSEGDKIVLHHNVFRRWHNMRHVEKNSRGYLSEDQYLVQPDQVFLVKRKNKNWECVSGFCFVQPIKPIEVYTMDTERPLIGIVKYSDGTVPEGELVGFSPNSEFEFVVDGKRVYRVLSKSITIKYEYQGDEEEYNPSWAGSR
tara:strand:+ start:5449 stop:6042 length:594 start_codon:yes stop_codon:yes gene_type:complete